MADHNSSSQDQLAVEDREAQIPSQDGHAAVSPGETDAPDAREDEAGQESAALDNAVTELPQAEVTTSVQCERFPMADGQDSEELVLVGEEIEQFDELAANGHKMHTESPEETETVAMDGSTIDGEADGSRRLSVKRSRPPSYLNNGPSVHVAYNNLTSESKKKLKEFLRQWAEWHGKFAGSPGESEKETLESGDETYFPALQVRGESNSTVHFWMDKPSKLARMEQSAPENKISDSQEQEEEVPLYDRAFNATLVPQETLSSMEGSLDLPEEVSRCFNCGSYSHSLKECNRPRDNTAINNARKMQSQRKGATSGPRGASRYYQNSPGGKFDDLKPGVLGCETRQSLGIGELDPPPWLNRMRELGYPPGYLDVPDEPSGITIFGTTEDSPDGVYIGEDGEIIGNDGKVTFGSQKMTVNFPGLNAPIPDNADERRWTPPLGLNSHSHSSIARTPVQKIGVRKTSFTSTYSAAAVTADGIEYTGTGDWGSQSDGPPGTGLEPSFRSPGALQSFTGSAGRSASRYSGEEQNARSGRANGNSASTTKPYLGRSTSDNSRRSPQVTYDEPRLLSPLSGQGLASRQSGLIHSPQAYHSPQAGAQHMHSPGWRTSYGRDTRDEMADARRQAWSQAYEALASSRKNDKFERSPARRR